MAHKRWSEIRAPYVDQARVAEIRRELERLYNRPWWRLVRVWDRLRAKVKSRG